MTSRFRDQLSTVALFLDLNQASDDDKSAPRNADASIAHPAERQNALRQIGPNGFARSSFWMPSNSPPHPVSCRQRQKTIRVFRCRNPATTNQPNTERGTSLPTNPGSSPLFCRLRCKGYLSSPPVPAPMRSTRASRVSPASAFTTSEHSTSCTRIKISLGRYRDGLVLLSASIQRRAWRRLRRTNQRPQTARNSPGSKGRWCVMASSKDNLSLSERLVQTDNFGRISPSWVQKLAVGFGGLPGRRALAEIKVAVFVAAHASWKSRHARLRKEEIAKGTGLTERTVRRARIRLHEAGLFLDYRGGTQCQLRLPGLGISAGNRKTERGLGPNTWIMLPFYEKDGWSKVFRLHMYSDWFVEANPSQILTYLAHCVFGGYLENDGRWGHFAVQSTVRSKVNQAEQTFKRNTQWLIDQAFEVVSIQYRAKWEHYKYYWLFGTHQEEVDTALAASHARRKKW